MLPKLINIYREMEEFKNLSNLQIMIIKIVVRSIKKFINF